MLLGVTLAWVGLSAIQVGGIAALLRSAVADSLATRDLLLDNKLFTGMRLFYAALPATGGLTAALLAAGLEPKPRHLCQLTLAANTVALLLLPLVMSQRLLLLQLLLAAYLGACLVRGRILGLRWVVLGVGIFLTLWIGREALTNPGMGDSATYIALQKLAFYMVNDMWNSFAPLSADIPHTWGLLSFEGAMVLTFTDGLFLPALEPKMEALEAVLGGGEFPFFTSAYVDFNLVGGAILIALMAALFRVSFHAAQRSVLGAAIYAQVGAALLFSSHSVYVTHQNFLVSILLIAAILRLSTRLQPIEQRTAQTVQTLFRSRRSGAEDPAHG